VVEPPAPDFRRQVRRIEAEVDDLPLDLLAEFRRYPTGPLDLVLVRVEFPLDEVADGLDHHLLLVGECEVHPLLPAPRRRRAPFQAARLVLRQRAAGADLEAP